MTFDLRTARAFGLTLALTSGACSAPTSINPPLPDGGGGDAQLDTPPEDLPSPPANSRSFVLNRMLFDVDSELLDDADGDGVGENMLGRLASGLSSVDVSLQRILDISLYEGEPGPIPNRGWVTHDRSPLWRVRR